jgi:hypothetical protein
MSVGLLRALAAHSEANIPGVRCYADETANTQHKYPCFYLTEIDTKRQPLGCGRVDYVERGDGGQVVKNAKLYEYKTVIRFQCEVPSDVARSGSEIVADLTKQIDLLFLEAVKSREKIIFADPVTGEQQVIVSIFPVSAADVPPDTGGEPVLYRRAASFRFIHRHIREESVKHTMDNIHVNP